MRSRVDGEGLVKRELRGDRVALNFVRGSAFSAVSTGDILSAAF